MLIGTYEHNLDAKGRLQVPAKLRADLGEAFIGTRGTGDCIFLFALEQWTKLVSKLQDVPFSNSVAQRFLRVLSANAFECVPDKQGRILIPKTLRDRIGLVKEAAVTGCMNRVEIWPLDKWQDYTEATESSYEEILEQLKDVGI